MKSMMKALFSILLLLPLLASGQKDWRKEFPKKPTNYVTDDANILSPREEELLNAKLRAFEDSTSNQLFVYLDDRYDNDLEDYSKEIFNTWGIGQKDKDNGILIATFARDREYRIQVGYGLEAALPSDLCKQIQDEEMGPHFKNENFYEGINAGIDKLIYYSKNKYEPPSPLQQMQIPLAVASVAGVVLFIINFLSLKKWNNQPKRKRQYLLFNILFLAASVTLSVIFLSFDKIEFNEMVIPASAVMIPLVGGLVALIILCIIMNDKNEMRHDHESDEAYDRRMREREERERRDSSSSSDDSFSGGGGGSSDSGGSSSRW
jgi:uncharacterized protein